MEGERSAHAPDERSIFTDAGDAERQPVLFGREASGDGGGGFERVASAHPSLRSAWAREQLREAIETERERGTGFVFAPVLLAAGAVAYFCWPHEPSILVLVALVVGAALAAFLLRSSQVSYTAALAIFLLLLGAAAGAVENWRHSTQMLGSAIATRITGTVVAVEDRANGRTRLTIDLISTERPELRFAPDRFRATAGDLPERLGPGDGVTGVVRLLPASGPARPNGFDFAFENYFDGIGANGFFLSGPFVAETGVATGFSQRIAAWVERQRLALATHIRARIGGPEGEVAAALVAGVRAGIPDEVTEALRRTGLAHFLAISGLHMALVAGTVIGAMRAGFALFPGFASRHAVKKYAAVGGLFALVAYLVLSGAAVAAQRAFIMFAVMLTAVLFDRAALTMRNLAIAAIIILAIAPHEVMGPSFQMSFAATAALIGAYGWYSERRMRRPVSGWSERRSPVVSALRLLGLFFVGLAMTSLIAGLATGLFAAWHFQRIAPLGLIANLAAMPIVTIAVMPLAVAGVLTMPFGLDGIFFAGMGKALALVIAVATALAEQSPPDIVGALPASAVAVLAGVLVVATIMTTWLRLAALPLLAVGLVLIALRQQPDVLVSEDGRLVAMRLEDDRLAVNRSRPSEFTLGIWQEAFRADETVKPARAEGDVVMPDAESAFVCSGETCIARHASGAVVAFAETGEAAKDACAVAALIVIDDATAEDVCVGRRPTVITKRDLAWRGSAEIRFVAGVPEIRFAIGEALRPWHDYRRWSREARGLPPWRRQSENDQ
ncbi:MAG: ComEC/Rec2 family competence protein [Rhizobiaceae bacterium]|nr:ComEC/Rec2 family competence protein [Rhizobiaceae bacterium]